MACDSARRSWSAQCDPQLRTDNGLLAESDRAANEHEAAARRAGWHDPTAECRAGAGGSGERHRNRTRGMWARAVVIEYDRG